MAGKIFISYRRSETAWAARALFERLRREFPDRVFIDIEGLSLGTKFNEVIDAHLEGCEVMLALIGQTWLAELQKRLEDEDEPDWVRAELARGLARGIPVVPVLVDGAAIPPRRELPADLKAVRDHHGLELHARYFDDQVGRLAREVRKMLSPTNEPAAPPSMDLAALVETAKVVTEFNARSITAPSSVSEPWMSAEGRDEFGRWAELSINGVVQRLRWIEPGEFWMGSTRADLKRFGEQGDDDWKKWIQNEAPRHRVKLTQGYWLADTACTQALWQTIVGDNPSHFTADLKLPVEQVSWDDAIQKFIPALNRYLVGAQAFLPTEAQWEYACRAGTETAYYFGEQIQPDQVNCADFSLPHGVGDSSVAKQTLRVKSLPPNGWGLHEMHGNVWEWCVETIAPYSKDLAVNPAVQAEGFERALRGGSWEDSAAKVRAACRGRSRHDSRWNNIGFRILVGSQQGSTSAPRRRVLNRGLEMLSPLGL